MSEKLVVAFYICVALFATYYGFAVIANTTQSVQPPRLPCGVSEISPDFGTPQREQCRQIGRHKL